VHRQILNYLHHLYRLDHQQWLDRLDHQQWLDRLDHQQRIPVILPLLFFLLQVIIQVL